MALTCRGASRVSLSTLGGHAGEAQRLELEGHLATCERCRADHALAFGLVQRLQDLETERLSPAAQEMVRRTVAAGSPAPRASARRSLRPLRVGTGFALAAAAIVCLVVWRGRGYQVIEGDVVVESPAAEAGHRSMVLRSVTGGRVRIADATVDLGSGTELLWNGHRRQADLRRGKVTFDVEHQVGQHLEVRTGRFTVEVVGTRFTVDGAGVHTDRGVVRVLRPDGSLVARVEAGASWSVEELTVPATATATARGLPAASRRVATAAVEEGPAPVTPAPGGSLRGARRALARGDAQATRRIVEPLFHLGRDVAVEARVLFAESFLLEGRYADAIDGYRLVVRDFPTTDQAEISQFAIAQLESEHGPHARARVALQTYLARYPHGRFAKEATERLGQLAARAR